MKYRVPMLSLVGALALAACQRGAEPADNAAANAAASDVAASDVAANSGAPVSADGVDTTFLTQGIQGDIAEVEMGKLAQSNGGTAAVRSFGAALVADHGAHKEKLTALAQQIGLPVPTTPPADAKAEHDRLAQLTGSQFDTAFKQAMIANHQKDIAMYEQQAKSSYAKTAALAKQTLPVLRNHLAAAKAL